MILQRLASAIRHQNWSQIITEILIVVIGIFLGLQVTEWNQEREDRASERRYLERLHSEVQAIIPRAAVGLESRVRRNTDLKDVSKLLSGEADTDSLSQAQCISVLTSHVFAQTHVSFPTLVELVNTGNLALIQNENIRLALSEYEIKLITWSSIYESAFKSIQSLSEKYSHIVKYDVSTTLFRPGSDMQQLNHMCDLAQMKQSDAFVNSFVENTSINEFTTNFVVRDFLVKLENLHQLLDEELGITHEEDEI
jgi:hypothetical protein